MTKRIGVLWISFLLLAGCGATRQISQVEVRQLSSEQESNSISGVRAKLSVLNSLPVRCSSVLRENLLPLTLEKVAYPDCSSSLLSNYPKISAFLEGDEKTLMEEVVNSKCRALSSDSSMLTLESFYQNFATTGPLGRIQDSKSSKKEAPPQAESLEAFRKGIAETISDHSPIDRWVKKNGDYILPDEDLSFFENFMVSHSCDRNFLEVEEGYRAIRNLEAILKHVSTPKVRERAEKLLVGLYQTIDLRAKELFFSHE